MNKILFKKTLRDMKISWAQSLALAVIIALGIAGLVSMAGAYRDLSSSYNYAYDTLHFADVDFSLQAAPSGIVEKIAHLDGVSAVTGRIIMDTGFDLPSGEPIRARCIGLPTQHQPAVDSLYIREGRYLQPGDKNAVLLESHFAQYYHLHPGDTITPIVNGKRTTMKVVGIASSPEYLVVSRSKQDVLPSPRTFVVLFVPLSQVQKTFSLADKVNDIIIIVKPGADRKAVIVSAQKLLEPYGVTATTRREHQPSNEALGLDLAGFKETAYLIPAFMFFVAAIAVYIMLSRTVHAQQPQIGLMKALGYSDSAVMLHYLTFALAIGVVGTVLGIAMGQPLASAITKVYAGTLGIPLVKTNLYVDLWAKGTLLMFVFLIGGGLGPARSSAKMPPATAMRFDPSAALVKGRTSIVEKLIPLPFWFRLPVRDVFRVRRRSLSTALGIIFSITLVLLGMAFLDSMNTLLHSEFTDIERWDMSALFSIPTNDAVLQQVRSWDGVKQAEPHMEIPSTLKANNKSQNVILYAMKPNTAMHPLHLVGKTNAQSVALSGRKIVLTNYMAQKIGVKEGDIVQVTTPFGVWNFQVGGLAKEYISAVAYISLDEAQKLAGAPIFNALYLKVDPNQQVMIKRKLYHLPGTANVQIKEGMQKDWDQFMGLYDAFVGIIFLFAVVLAFTLLFNTMTVSVLERQREYATMRAIGASGGRISWLMAMESVILWMLTLVPGLLLGWLVSYYAMSTFNSDLFVFYLTIKPMSYVLTSVGILVVMLLSALPAIRHVNRLNLAEAIKIIT